MKDNIQSLIIGGNRIRNNGVKEIAEGFQHNHSLTVLKLYRCMLTEEGIHKHICTMNYSSVIIHIVNICICLSEKHDIAMQD